MSSTVADASKTPSAGSRAQLTSWSSIHHAQAVPRRPSKRWRIYEPNALATSRVTRRRWREMSVVFVPPDAIPLWRWLSSTCSPRPSTSRRSSSSNATHELRPPSYPFRIQLARRREPDLRDGPPRRRDGHAGDRADGPWRPLRRSRSVSPGKGRGHEPDNRPGSLRRDALAPSERRPSRSGSSSPDPAGQESGRLSQPDQAIQPRPPRGVLLQASNRQGPAGRAHGGTDRALQLPRRRG